MRRAAETFDLLARALAPPAGDPEAFSRLGVAPAVPAALAAEHVALFGRAGRAVLSPYEGERVGTGLAAVLRSCAERGYAPDPSFRDRPDHVSVPLAVQASLCREVERAIERGSREAAREAAARARAFFAERVGSWVPAFLESMAQLRDFPLHRALARGLLRRGVAPRADGEARVAGPPPHEPACAACGGPLGYLLPPGATSPWGLVCAGCRLRADLRRSKP